MLIFFIDYSNLFCTAFSNSTPTFQQTLCQKKKHLYFFPLADIFTDKKSDYFPNSNKQMTSWL